MVAGLQAEALQASDDVNQPLDKPDFVGTLHSLHVHRTGGKRRREDERKKRRKNICYLLVLAYFVNFQT